jgi:outer membrane protein assembly factor BamB
MGVLTQIMNTKLRGWFALGVFSASCLCPVAADWPMFRGSPGLTGVAADPIHDKPMLAWSAKLGSSIKSSAAIVGERVFVGADSGMFHVLNLKTGTNLWSFKTDGPIESSPLVLDGVVYFGSSDNFVYALDAEKGTLKWKYETGDKVLGGPNHTLSPDGKTNWIVVGSYDFKLHCIDALSGKAVWTYETGNYINGTPAISGEWTVFGGCDALLHVISVKDGKKVKEMDAGAYIAGSGAFADGRFYIGHYENEFLAFDLNKAAVAWKYRDRAFPYFSSPALAGGQVIFGGRDKRLHCLKQDTGELVWVFGTRAKVDSSPVVAGDRVVVGSEDGRLYILSVVDGKELWNYEIGQGITASPAVSNGKIVIGSNDGSVYCFAAPAKP